jgi:hypothetical protein
MVSQKTKKQMGQMQTPGAENAMLKNRVAGCVQVVRDPSLINATFSGCRCVNVTMRCGTCE